MDFKRVHSDADKERLRLFARAVGREVSVRTGDHPPKNEAERIQAAQGVAEIWELDAVRARVAASAEGYFGDVDAAGRPCA